MMYFSYVAKGQLSTAEITQKRVELFKLIFDQKFRVEETGYYKSVSDYKEKFIENLLTVLEQKYNDSVSKKELKATEKKQWYDLTHFAEHSQPKVAAAYQLGLIIIRRLHQLEKFIAPGSDVDVLRKVFSQFHNDSIIVRFSKYGDPEKKHSDWINNKELGGYSVLATNEDGTHAESKIVDFLLAAGLFSATDLPKVLVVIGISKKCCLYCHGVIDLTKNVVEEGSQQKRDVILVSGSHQREFDAWNQMKPLLIKEYQLEEVVSGKLSNINKSDTIKKKILVEVLVKLGYRPESSEIHMSQLSGHSSSPSDVQAEVDEELEMALKTIENLNMLISTLEKSSDAPKDELVNAIGVIMERLSKVDELLPNQDLGDSLGMGFFKSKK